MNPSTVCARVLVDELIANGVTDAVLSPGSRNAPLSVALQQADAAGRLRLHVRIDERTAGFLAVGLARTSGRPVPVVTTSGTAVANLHPAVLEAHHGSVPLLVLTADRPPALRDVGANQVIDQTDVFGSALRFFHEFGVPTAAPGQNARWRSMVCRALAAAVGAAGTPGPVHLNLPLAEPLLPDDAPRDWSESIVGRSGPDGPLPWTRIDVYPAGAAAVEAPAAGEKVLVVAELGAPLAGELAAAGHPVVSESAGLAGPRVLDAGIHLLARPEWLARHRPDRVLVLGRPTLYRQVTRLLTDPDRVVDIIAPPTGWRGIAGNARTVGSRLTGPGARAPQEWASAWAAANAAARSAVHRVLDAGNLADSPVLARELAACLAEGTALVIGSSQPVRDIGLASRTRTGITVSANRGVAGIDGTNSTAIGTALARTGPTVAYLGDVTFLHDLPGLVIGPAEPRPDLTIVVSNNDGGGIFSTLEPGEPAHAESFERVFGTPHGVDLGLLARGAGAGHSVIGSAAELRAALRSGAGHGIRILEVATDRHRLRPQLDDITAAVAAALA